MKQINNRIDNNFLLHTLKTKIEFSHNVFIKILNKLYIVYLTMRK